MNQKILSSIMLLLLVVQPCWASPTGLNNIPTTDITPDRTLVLQGWSEAGNDAKPLYSLGAKYGILDRVEIGLDSKVSSGGAGPVAFQAKLKALDFDFGFSGLLGIENMATEGDFGDNVAPYAVFSQDIKLFRLHTGYNFQKDNFALFEGVDRTVKLFNQELILRSDIRQVNDRDDLLMSAGFLLTLPFDVALESWFSVPTDSGAEETVTVKFNYVMKF